jgi:CHAT domain-containing protein/tetratricopeptide (TPR) repeat protein
MTATHVFECDICSAAANRPTTSRAHSIAKATSAVAAVVVGVLLALRPTTPIDDPVQRLVAAASREARTIEPRVSGGFSWAPLHQSAQRGSAESTSGRGLRLAAITSGIIQTAQQDSSPRVQHSAAMASLLQDDPRQALSMLEALTTTSAAAEVWNDLAATRYVIAVRENDPAYLARALAAADAALRMNVKMPEARFNRALILGRLGLRELAREQWDEYLDVDAESPWASEARQHIRELEPEPQFADLLARQYEQLANDPDAAHLFARRHRLDARLWGETEILGRWAMAEQVGDRALAAKHLVIAREFGTELVRDRGDEMLRALVGAIESADSTQRKLLAEAHLAFRAGQKLYKENEPGRAEGVLIGAAHDFARGGSPGALLARYFAANIAYSLGRVDESKKKIEQLLAETPPRYSAHRAQLLWQAAILHAARARWGESIEAYAESTALFERLGEDRYAAINRDGLARSYERTGNAAEAWKHRMIALPELGRATNVRLQGALTNLSVFAVTSGEYDEARSLFRLAIEVSRKAKDSVAETSTILLRARFHLREGADGAALIDLAEAKAALANVKDSAYRELLQSHIMFVEARLSPNPAESVDLLTKVLDFHRTKRRGLLPELYLERGRAWYRMHDELRAASDFEAGVAELEGHRESLASSEDRWGVFYDADDLFREAIALSLEQHDPERAFEYAERARARSLLDALGARLPTVDRAAIPADTILVEYATHPKGLVLFVLDQRGVRAVDHSIDRSVLLREIRSLNDAARASDRSELRRAGRTVYRCLIEPVESELAGKRMAVFIPDPKFGNVPFAATVDGAEQFLIEKYAIAVAPSAATYTRLRGSNPQSAERRALIVTGAENLGPLVAAARESNSVAAAYSRSVRLSRDTATPAAFARAVTETEVVHFAGHAVAARRGYLQLTPGETSDGRLYAKDIASMRLRRTSVVVLAACGTAAGEIRSTEGTISVARAFLVAGVPSVIATLWPIDDEDAAQFFPIVHRHMSRGAPPAEALRAAQLEWIRDRDASTALWAGTQLIGK